MARAIMSICCRAFESLTSIALFLVLKFARSMQRRLSGPDWQRASASWSSCASGRVPGTEVAAGTSSARGARNVSMRLGAFASRGAAVLGVALGAGGSFAGELSAGLVALLATGAGRSAHPASVALAERRNAFIMKVAKAPIRIDTSAILT